MNFESQKQHQGEPSEINPLETEEGLIKEAVNSIMVAKVEGDNTEEGWMEGSERMAVAEMFLKDLAVSDKVKEEILKRVKELVAKD